jgi:hypothetical protein
MTFQTIAIDDIPAEDLNLAPVALDQWHSVPQQIYNTVDIPLYPGQRVTGIGSHFAPRRFPLKFLFQPASFAARDAALTSLVSRFAGQVQITTRDNPNKVLFAYLEQMPVTAPYNAFVEPFAVADIQLVAFDPLWYDKYPVVGSAAAGASIALAMGSAAVRRLLVHIIGAVTNPVIILYDQTGTEIQRMTFTIVLGANDYLSVDMDRGTIVKSVNGVLSDAFATWATQEAFLQLRPPYSYTLTCSGAALFTYHHRSYKT